MRTKTSTMTAKSSKTTDGNKKRRIKTAHYRSFRLQKKIPNVRPSLPSVRTLLSTTTRLLIHNWKFFFGISLVYGILIFIFVRSVGGGVDVVGLKQTINELGLASGNVGTSITLFGVLISGSSADNAQLVTMYQSIIVLITGLAIMWGLRQVSGKQHSKLSAKDAFYRGMHPLIPVVLVLVVMGLQLIPVSLGVNLYTATVESGLAVTIAEQAFWTVLAVLLGLLSLYMISSSIFALFIASLPNMTPVRALRSARQLVLHRRWEVLRKLIALPIVLLIILGLVVIPIIAVVPILAEAVFFVASVIILPFALAYIYELYRSML